MKKKRFLGSLIASIMMVVMLAPVAFAATKTQSATWDFTMSLTAVNGAKNGQYYSFQSGTKNVSGKIWASTKGSSDKPGSVYVEVWRDTLGADKLVGQKTVSVSTTLNTKTSFSMALGTQPKDQYYFVFGKQVKDGWKTHGSGTITNTYTE